MRRSLVILLTCVGCTTGFAKLIEGVGVSPARVIEESGLKVPVFSEVKAAAPGVPAVSLHLTGAGVRKKKVAFFHVNVYVLSSYVDNSQKLPADAPMNGIVKSKVHALQLTFLRDLSAEQVRNAFAESLEHNGAKIDSPAIQKTLSQFNREVPKGSTMTLLGFDKGPDQVLIVETPQGTFSTEGPGLATEFWKIWFGNPTDGDLETLKGELAGART